MPSGRAELGLMVSLVQAHAGGLYSRSFLKDSLVQWLTWEEAIDATSRAGHTQLGLGSCVWSQTRNCFCVQFCLKGKV